MWLRATGSTAVSQLVDSFVVLYIAFVLGPQHWPMPLFLAVGTVNYVYKMSMAIALIPLLYLGRRLIRAYLARPAVPWRLMPRPRTPEVSVDLVIELMDRPGRPIVIIRRGHPPPGHALPGGFVDIGETVEHAAGARGARGDGTRREAQASCSASIRTRRATRADTPWRSSTSRRRRASPSPATTPPASS